MDVKQDIDHRQEYVGNLQEKDVIIREILGEIYFIDIKMEHK